jgi:hypothetical protein
MKLSFTGTRDGLSVPQQGRLVSWLCLDADPFPTEFHTGLCVGADELATKIVHEFALAGREPRIVGHPPDDDKLVSARARSLCRELRPPRPYLERNHAIVDETETLVACPKGMSEEWRSGTWATVRYGRKQGKRVVIIWPDGTVTEEKGTRP